MPDYSFTKYGDTFTQLERKENVCIYRRDRNAQCKGFEVMVILNKPACMLGGKFIPAGEGFPSSSQWGLFGWSFLATEKDRAYEKFNSEVEKRSDKPKTVRRIVRVIKRN